MDRSIDLSVCAGGTHRTRERTAARFAVWRESETCLLRFGGRAEPRLSTSISTTGLYSGKWSIGRIYEVRGALPDQRWYWSFFGSVSRPADMTSEGREPTLESAISDRVECRWQCQPHFDRATRRCANEQASHEIRGGAGNGRAQPPSLAPDHRHGDRGNPANGCGRNRRVSDAAPTRFIAGVADDA